MGLVAWLPLVGHWLLPLVVRQRVLDNSHVGLLLCWGCSLGLLNGTFDFSPVNSANIIQVIHPVPECEAVRN